MPRLRLSLTPLALALLGASSALHAELYISEYVEGSSNNKAIEIYNPGPDAVDLAAGAYALKTYSNGSASASTMANLSGTIPAGATFVFAHASANATILARAQQTGSAAWYNGDDAVALVKGTAPIDVIGQIGFRPSPAWGTGDVTTQDHTLRRKASVSAGDSNGSDVFEPALEWDGFAVDTFDGLGSHNGSGGNPSEPEPEPEPNPTPGSVHIYDIQGAGHVSPLKGQSVSNVPGIVTVVKSNGFYFQDPDGDNNSATSDGVLVYTGSRPTVVAGDAVLVSGTVTEYRPGNDASNLSVTELTSVTVVKAPDLYPGKAIAPLVLGQGGRPFPTTVLDNDTHGSLENPAQTQYDPAEDGIDFYESLEGMWVELKDARAVSPTNQYGETWLVADGGAAATGMNARGGLTIASDDANPERLQMDDTLMGAAAPKVHVGAKFGNVSGIIDYSFGAYELLPSSVPSVVENALERADATLVPDSDELTIAGYNVENLDTNPNDGDDDVGTGKLAAIAGQIVEKLKSPAILALQEVQDNDGATASAVVDADVTLSALADAIVAAGGPRYSWSEISPVKDQDGGQPGGNIRLAYLYDASRVSLVPSAGGAGDSTTPVEVVTDGTSVGLSHNPGRINPTDAAWDASRKPLVAQFRFHERDVFVINNHFTSKGGSSPAQGVQQPMVNGGEDQRAAQAALVNAFVRSLLAADPKARVVALGDFNEFGWMAPMQTLKGGASPILTDLADYLLPETERYSYVFEGNAQELDHVLVSDSLKDKARFEVLHVNAEFHDQLSDHDPSRTLIKLTPPQAPIADAGADQSVLGLDSVTLDAGASRHPDGEELRYAWVQTDGKPVSLSGADTATPSFTVPNHKASLRFTVTVSDRYGKSAQDEVVVKVAKRKGPSAEAGWPMVVGGGSRVQLDGSRSKQPYGEALSYEWTQLAGRKVNLDDAHSATPSFTAGRSSDLLVFQLTVRDAHGLSASDFVFVLVTPQRHHR